MISLPQPAPSSISEAFFCERFLAPKKNAGLVKDQRFFVSMN